MDLGNRTFCLCACEEVVESVSVVRACNNLELERWEAS